MAGALGIAIAGPRHYGGTLSVDGLMGEGGRYKCTPNNIRRALRLYRAADAVMVALVAGLALIVWGW